MKKYRLLEKIGSGSFGAIYVGTHPSIQENTSIPENASQLNLYLISKQGKKRKRRRTTTIRNQTLPTLSRHQYPSHYPAGVSRLIDYGSDPDHDRIFMVIELFELSLEDLFQIW
jgi:serine/threonine protein kinase